MRKQTKRWTMKDGKKIRICDMSDCHLANAIAMLEKIAKIAEPEYEAAAWSFLCSLRGEYAIMAAEQEIDNLMENGLDPCEISPLYNNLVKEQTRRRVNG